MSHKQADSGLVEIDHVPDAVWLNFSFMVRESITATEVKTGMERSQHLTSAVYFGTVALEAFLNEQMRAHMTSESEEAVVDKLRHAVLKDKIKKWPLELLGKSLNINSKTLDLITEFHGARDDLTHPKKHGYDAYSRLNGIDPMTVIDSTAEYFVRFHEEKQTRYPYWLFGWNYLNPRPDSCAIFVVNSDAFCWSLQGLGFRVSPGDDRWQDQYLGTYDGYLMVRQALDSIDRCEPKFDLFPYKPILCRRWWMPNHQTSCGHVSKAAIDFARGYGNRKRM
jgi:hypothetical protein